MNMIRCARLTITGFGFAIVATTSLIPRTASAQAADGFSIGLGGGFVSGPASNYGSSVGYYVLPTLEFPSLLKVFRPRLDGMHAEWGGGRLSALTANVLFTPVSGKRVAPYLLAGAGAYAMPGSTVKSGWTLGAGLRLPGELRAITIESRLHVFLRDIRRSPIMTPAGIVWSPGSGWASVWAPIGLGIQF